MKAWRIVRVARLAVKTGDVAQGAYIYSPVRDNDGDYNIEEAVGTDKLE